MTVSVLAFTGRAGGEDDPDAGLVRRPRSRVVVVLGRPVGRRVAVGGVADELRCSRGCRRTGPRSCTRASGRAGPRRAAAAAEPAAARAAAAPMITPPRRRCSAQDRATAAASEPDDGAERCDAQRLRLARGRARRGGRPEHRRRAGALAASELGEAGCRARRRRRPSSRTGRRGPSRAPSSTAASSRGGTSGRLRRHAAAAAR